MDLVIRCKCGTELQTSAAFTGRVVECPCCQQQWIVPGAEAPSPKPSVQKTYGLANTALRQTNGDYPQAKLRSPTTEEQAATLFAGIIITGLIILFLGSVIAFLFWSDESSPNALAESTMPESTSATASTIVLKQDGKTNSETNFRIGAAQVRENSKDNRASRKFSLTTGRTELLLPDLIDSVDPSMVRLDVAGAGGNTVGSGFFVDDLGTIATAFHIIQGASSIDVTPSDGVRVPAIGFLAADVERDIAIICVDAGEFDATPLPIANRRPGEGQRVAAFGSPMGHHFTATRGVVSGSLTGAEVNEMLNGIATQVDLFVALGYQLESSWLQTDASISSGNSGGPLVDYFGEVVGVNSWGYPHEGLNFASTADEFRGVLAKRTNGPRSFNALPKREIDFETFGIAKQNVYRTVPTRQADD